MADFPVNIAESVPLSESVVASRGQAVGIAESVDLIEGIAVVAGTEIGLTVTEQRTTGVTITAELPVELGFSPRNFEAGFTSLSFTSPDGGVPLQIERVTKEFDVYHTGSSAYLRHQAVDVDEAAARRNIFEASEDFSDPYWAPSAGTITSNAITAPPGYGGQVADEFFEDSSTTRHRPGVVTLDLGADRLTFSVFAKKSNRVWMLLGVNNGPGWREAYFDLDNGVVGGCDFPAGQNPVWGMQHVGDGWYWCWMSVDLPDNSRLYYVGSAESDGGATYTGLDQSALYVFGASLTRTDEVVPYLKSGEPYTPYAELVIPKILEDSDFEAFTGNYAEITIGPNEGIYQIRRVLAEDVEGPQQVVLQLDQPLLNVDLSNGYVQGLVDDYVTYWIEPGVGDAIPTIVWQYNIDLTTVADPIIELLLLEQRDAVTPGSVTIVLGSVANTIEVRATVDLDYSGADAVFFILGRITPKVEWRVISGVQQFVIETSKPTAGKTYELSIESLRTKEGQFVDLTGYLIVSLGDVQLPRVIGASLLGDEGTVLVEYDQAMQSDADALFNPDDYGITGPTDVTVHQVTAYTLTTVALKTAGLGVGDYTLTLSTGTPKDVAGNPINPTWNAAVFTSSAPLTFRSVFTDKGPIAKPPLTIQSGVNATLDSFTEVSLPGAALTSDHVGKYLTLSGGSINGGTFRVTSILTATQARLQASFTLPDPSSGSLNWELFDPQNGLIADDPGDVTVRVNGSPVTPDAVIGLLGQIVLSAAPGPTDDVKVDYSCICNPTVDFRQLNSKAFRLNAWNRDAGYPNDLSQHKYRFNNVLVRPSDYEPDDPPAVLDQPELREMHYRAYERAYTAVLNDPSLLLLNSPIHRIAYPPAQRTVEEEFVAYEGTGLPESQVVNPWTREGAGTATSTSGVLTIEDDSSGDYPTGQPLFWSRDVDLTFPHVFAMSWRFLLDVVTEFDGVFSGVAAGYSDEEIATIVGYLEDGGTKQIGFLKRGSADDPSGASAWMGGLDSGGAATGQAADFDWSTLHSYRVLRDQDGTVKLFVDGDIDPILQATADELPFLVELGAPFDAIQGVFFGSVSRPARSTSSWDFIRYLAQPTNPLQTSPSSFVSYEANVVPEADAKPWTPVGYHGTATVISTDFLLLDSTSASDVSDVGLMGGDYRGYLRFEPLLTRASEFVVDANVQLRTHTHGITPDGLMFAVDDGERLMQVCFLTDQAMPKISYGGRSLPDDFSPFAWSSMGTQTAAMAGRVLLITDASGIDGRVYYYDDTAPATSDDRVVASTTDYFLEFRCKVVSYTVDGSGFAGVFGQVFDGTRSVGLLLQESGGTKYASLQSDGVVLSQFIFNWGDGVFHTYRLAKSTSGDLISLFVDGTFLGSLAYSSFTAPAPSTTGQVSFGSSTPASMSAESVIEWTYCNAWRTRSDLRRFLGLWKGSDDDTLLGYHLPLKTAGKGATAVGNALGDGNADFVAAGVAAGDPLVVDDGPNRGVYEVAAVVDGQNLTLTGVWPQQPSLVDYRIVQETDWSVQHKYRLTRDSTGQVTLLLDADPDPLILVGYNSIDLPISGVGIVRTLSGGLPAIAFGSFDVENLAQSYWDYVRYGITRSPTEMRIVPHHEVVNQWNVMASPEHLFTGTPHEHTDYKSSSTGQPPKVDPDFLADIRENLFTYSGDFSNAVWLRTGGSLTADAIAAPPGFDGYADEYIEDTATSQHRAAYVAIGTGATGWSYGAPRATVSCYFKYTGRQWVSIMMHNLPGWRAAWFDIQNGMVGSDNFDAASHAEVGIEVLENGWYRCWVTLDLPDTWHWFMFIGRAADGDISDYSGSGSWAV